REPRKRRGAYPDLQKAPYIPGPGVAVLALSITLVRLVWRGERRTGPWVAVGPADAQGLPVALDRGPRVERRVVDARRGRGLAHDVVESVATPRLAAAVRRQSRHFPPCAPGRRARRRRRPAAARAPYA